ncbi:hypothetical protein DGWBC_1732 [Dehalogenimonas sp. WBC-2]|nr:hypothetical protein DGWBC_1732 [Dehalogenimonas sp. WBC-2]
MGTKAKGSVILFGAEGVTERINIITWVEIDPNDWGGVSFYISQEWSVSGITSSYPKSATQDGESVVIWRTADQSAEYDKWIEIGADHTAYTPTGGGTGVVIIELDYIGKKTDSAKPFSVMVGVGSDDKDGIMIRHPDFKVIEVSP